MYKILLTLLMFLTMTTAYSQQHTISKTEYGNPFSDFNPFDTRYYYPGFALPNDFDPIPDTPRNRKMYPGLFELHDWQMMQLRQREQKLNQHKRISNRF